MEHTEWRDTIYRSGSTEPFYPMHISFKSAISAASKHLPDEVLSLPVRRALSRISPILSTSCSSYYYEWHLANPMRLDLLCSLTYENSQKFITRVASTKADNRHNAPLLSMPDVVNTLSHWDTLQSKLGDRVSHIWLAFDYQSGTAAFDTPNIHYCIDRNFMSRLRERDYINRLSEKVFNKTADAIISTTLPKKIQWPKSLLKQYYQLIDGLGGEIIHLSFMHSRTPPTAKLNMTIPSDALPTLLSAVAWPGDRAAVIALCKTFTPNEQRIKGNICITEETCNRFELELEYNVPLATDPRRKVMLDTLHATGLATKNQTKIMRTWAGREDIPYRNGFYTFERWLDCKIYFLPDGTTGAKPYFGFAPLPRIGWNRNTLHD